MAKRKPKSPPRVSIRLRGAACPKCQCDGKCIPIVRCVGCRATFTHQQYLDLWEINEYPFPTTYPTYTCPACGDQFTGIETFIACSYDQPLEGLLPTISMEVPTPLRKIAVPRTATDKFGLPLRR